MSFIVTVLRRPSVVKHTLGVTMEGLLTGLHRDAVARIYMQRLRLVHVLISERMQGTPQG